jgi:proteic killer suppression protein
MIASFAGKLAQEIYDGCKSKRTQQLPQELHGKARRLLDQLNAAPSLEFMKIPPGNRLEKLAGALKGHWSVRINDQWRITFRWQENDAHDVAIVDYH